MSAHSFLTWKVSVEKFAINLLGTLLNLTSLFFLSALKIIYLSLIFDYLIIICLSVALFGFNLVLDALNLMDLGVHFSPPGQEVSSHCCFKWNIFSVPFSFFSPGILRMQILCIFIVSYSSCRFFSLSFFYLSAPLTGKFSSSYPQIADSSFCIVESTFASICWILQFSYRNFQPRVVYFS